MQPESPRRNDRSAVSSPAAGTGSRGPSKAGLHGGEQQHSCTVVQVGSRGDRDRPLCDQVRRCCCRVLVGAARARVCSAPCGSGRPAHPGRVLSRLWRSRGWCHGSQSEVRAWLSAFGIVRDWIRGDCGHDLQSGLPGPLADAAVAAGWDVCRSGERFSLPPGVRVSIPHYGLIASAPAYSGFYSALEAAGYGADRDLVVAGYDFLLTPDLGGFLAGTKHLIERTWRRNHHRPVRLVGHSNGPLYVQYLLTHVSKGVEAEVHSGLHRHRREASTLPAGGSIWSFVFNGAEISHGVLCRQQRSPQRAVVRACSARSPSTWMSASDPAVFGRREVVDQEPGNRPQLYAGRHLPTPSRCRTRLD